MRFSFRSMPTILILLVCSPTFSQVVENWKLANGKAFSEKTVIISEHASNQLYEDLVLWVSSDAGSNKILTERVNRKCIYGSRTYTNNHGPVADVKIYYRFRIDFQSDKVVFKIHDAVVNRAYASYIDVYEPGVPVEDFFASKRRSKRKDVEAEEIVALIESFSSDMLKSFEDVVLVAKASQ